LVVRTGSTVFSVTGAVSCLQRLTILERDGATAGVVGLNPARVRFMSVAGADSWIDPDVPFSRDIARVLGVKPDARGLGQRGPVGGRGCGNGNGRGDGMRGAGHPSLPRRNCATTASSRSMLLVSSPRRRSCREMSDEQRAGQCPARSRANSSGDGYESAGNPN